MTPVTPGCARFDVYRQALVEMQPFAHPCENLLRIGGSKLPSIRADIEIGADASHVWALLSDLAAYPRWNPSIVELDGPLSAGAVLRFRARLPGGIVMSPRPVLSCVRATQELSWRAWLVHPRFFFAEHRFILESQPGGVRLIQREEFHGWFAPFFALFFARGLRRSYAQANARLKRLAEEGTV